MANDRPIISEWALAIMVENRIRTTIEAGEFDNLLGLGRPPRSSTSRTIRTGGFGASCKQDELTSLQLRKDRELLSWAMDSQGDGIGL